MLLKDTFSTTFFIEIINWLHVVFWNAICTQYDLNVIVEINENCLSENKQVIYSVLVRPRESATITGIWQKTPRQAGLEKRFCSWKEKKIFQVCSDWNFVGMEKLGRLAWGIFCDWFGKQIWLSLLGPELELGKKYW